LPGDRLLPAVSAPQGDTGDSRRTASLSVSIVHLACQTESRAGAPQKKYQDSRAQPHLTDFPTMASYPEKKQRISDQFKSAQGELRLEKDTSNLFRDRAQHKAARLNVRDFNQVVGIDSGEGWVEVEGMTPYVRLTDATLAHGAMPCVVPQLQSITIGGAIAGVGIESTSFRYGLVHETILEMDVLTGSGEIVTCSPHNEHSDLFFGLPNSYGTLGYVLKLKARTIPVRPYVRLEHIHHPDAETYFRHLGELCNEPDVDFLDGTLFEPGQFYITVGRFTDRAPYLSDYTYKDIYYQSIRQRREDYLTVRDYIWRWDTDWFWCSKNVGAQNPLLRRLMGRKRLNSVFYTKLMRWNAKWGFTRWPNRLRGVHTESVIQDIDIPLENCAAYYEFFDREIGIRPVWVCPIGVFDRSAKFPLYPMDADQRYVNFGHWDVVSSRQPQPEGYFNKLVEKRTAELGGIKSLYSDSYYPEPEFWEYYNQSAYRSLKRKYDPNGHLKDLYRKCVLRE
jgi:FAD/FMN-containing dehydrogenase